MCVCRGRGERGLPPGSEVNALRGLDGAIASPGVGAVGHVRRTAASALMGAWKFAKSLKIVCTLTQVGESRSCERRRRVYKRIECHRGGTDPRKDTLLSIGVGISDFWYEPDFESCTNPQSRQLGCLQL